MNKTLVAIVVVLAVVLGYFGWNWTFCRVYVPPGHMAIITSKVGKPLQPGQILAEKGQKGVLADPLGPGRHFMNPFNYTHQIQPLTFIPPGKIGVVTSKVGEDLPSGQFLAKPGQKGIWKDPIGPGLYPINPMGYNVEVIDAVSIPVGYVGVITSLAGSEAEQEAFASSSQKGVMENILQPGLYYINPKAYKVDVIEVGVNQVSLSGKTGGAVLTKNVIAAGNQAVEALQSKMIASQQAQRSAYMEQSQDLAAVADSSEGGAIDATEFILNQHVEFPSRDGFEISLDMTVEFELLPENVARIYRDIGDMPAVVDKILMPQILSVSRLKGSAYRAIDFIVGDGREKFQNDLTDTLAEVLTDKNITIHDALIRHVNVPSSILEPLQNASIAVEQDLTNQERQKTEMKLAELNTETQLIKQRSEEVKQQTEKLKAEIEAEKMKAVAEIEAQMTRQVASLERQTAEELAQKEIVLGKANADALLLTEGERANGFNLKVTAFGDPKAYTMAEFANAINPDMKIKIIHAGQGTLWTDGDFSKGEAALIQNQQKE